jgi:hypothetical protein
LFRVRLIFLVSSICLFTLIPVYSHAHGRISTYIIYSRVTNSQINEVAM